MPGERQVPEIVSLDDDSDEYIAPSDDDDCLITNKDHKRDGYKGSPKPSRAFPSSKKSPRFNAYEEFGRDPRKRKSEDYPKGDGKMTKYGNIDLPISNDRSKYSSRKVPNSTSPSEVLNSSYGERNPGPKTDRSGRGIPQSSSQTIKGFTDKSFNGTPVNLTINLYNQEPGMNLNNSNLDLNSLIMSSLTAVNKVQQKQTETVDDAYDYFAEEDIAWMIKNFKELEAEEKNHLLAYVKKLEKRDPIKMKRLKSQVHRK